MLVALVPVACRQAEQRPAGARLALRVAPLSLPGIGVACYDVRVTNAAAGAGETVWARGDPTRPWRDDDAGTADDDTTLCSNQWGNSAGGDVAYVGPCDAGDAGGGPGGVSQQPNSILLWVDGLYDRADPPQPLAATGQGWRNPCPYDPSAPNQGACVLEAMCVENHDTAVVVNLTIMRDAKQGFFDAGVNFEDVFCSLKVDCSRETPSGEAPIDLLFSPADGQRVPTVVLGFACTGGAAADTTGRDAAGEDIPA